MRCEESDKNRWAAVSRNADHFTRRLLGPHMREPVHLEFSG